MRNPSVSSAITSRSPDIEPASPKAGAAGALPYQGSWRVARRIVDIGQGQVWTFAGRAEITDSAFVEHGWLTRRGTAMPASRRYLLDVQAGDGVDVRRADGSLFIRLTRAPSQTVAHLCGADLYSGRFIFPGMDRWIEAWRVRGPRKNYRSVTRYERSAGDAAP